MPQEAEIINPPAVTEFSLRDLALAELNKVEVGIEALREQFLGMTRDASNTLGMAELKAARLDIRDRRYLVPKIVEDKKRQLREIGKDIETVGDSIVGSLLELETPIDAQIKAEEARKAQIKADEQARKDSINAFIDKIKAIPAECTGLSIVELEQGIEQVKGLDLADRCQELVLAGEEARTKTIATLQTMLEEKQQQEAENLRIKAEQEAEAARLADVAAEQERAMEVQRQELAAAKVEQDRLNAIESEKVAAERAELEKSQAVERDRLAAEKVEQDKALAIQKEALDAERAELAQLRADALALQTANEAKAQEERNAAALKLAEEQAVAKKESDRLAEEQRLKDQALAVEAEKARIVQASIESQRRIDALTETHFSTLQAILAMAEDDSMSHLVARKGIIHLAKTGIERRNA